MKLSSQNEVEGDYLVSIEVVFLPSGIADEVQEEFEERPLMIMLVLFSEHPVKDVHDRLDCMV